MKVGDLIFWHWNNTIALVISVILEKNQCHENLWVCLLEDGMLISDDLSDGYTIIDEKWKWPVWHVNSEDDAYESR
jgi:hypothetical protein